MGEENEENEENTKKQLNSLSSKISAIISEIIDLTASIKVENIDKTSQLFNNKIQEIAEIGEIIDSIFFETEDGEYQTQFLQSCLSRVRFKSIQFLEVSQRILSNPLDYLAKEEQRSLSRDLREYFSHFKEFIQILDIKEENDEIKSPKSSNNTLNEKLLKIVSQSSILGKKMQIILQTTSTLLGTSQTLQNCREYQKEIQSFRNLISALTEITDSEKEQFDKEIEQIYQEFITNVKDLAKKGQIYPDFVLEESTRLYEKSDDGLFEFVVKILQKTLKYAISDLRPSRPARSKPSSLSSSTDSPPLSPLTDSTDSNNEDEEEGEESVKRLKERRGSKAQAIGPPKLTRQQPILAKSPLSNSNMQSDSFDNQRVNSILSSISDGNNNNNNNSNNNNSSSNNKSGDKGKEEENNNNNNSNNNNNNSNNNNSNNYQNSPLRKTKISKKKAKKRTLDLSVENNILESQLANIALNCLLEKKCLTSEWMDESNLRKLKEKLQNEFREQMFDFNTKNQTILSQSNEESQSQSRRLSIRVSKDENKELKDIAKKHQKKLKGSAVYRGGNQNNNQNNNNHLQQLSKQPSNLAILSASKWKNNNKSMDNLLKGSLSAQLRIVSNPLIAGSKSFIDSILSFLEKPESYNSSSLTMLQASILTIFNNIKLLSEASDRFFSSSSSSSHSSHSPSHSSHSSSSSTSENSFSFLLMLQATTLTSSLEPEKNDLMIGSLQSETSLPSTFISINQYRFYIFDKIMKFRALVFQIGSSISSINQSITQSSIMQIATCCLTLVQLIVAINNMIATSSYLSLRYFNNNSSENNNKEIIDQLEKEFNSSFGDLNVVGKKGNEKENIWNESSLPAHTPGSHFSLKASLDQLLIELTTPNSSYGDFKKAFVKTSSCFTKMEIVFKKLQQRFRVPQNIDANSRSQIQTLVCELLIYFIQLEPHFFFSDSLITKVSEFEEKEVSKFNKEISEKLKSAIEFAKSQKKKILTPLSASDLPPIPSLSMVDLVPVSHIDLFMNSSEESIALAITAKDFEIFQKIQSIELLNLAWSSTKLKHRSQNVLNLIHRMNEISFWVPSLILWHSSLTDRAKVFEKFLSICDEMKKLNNYNGLMGILAGLNVASVCRLNLTKLAVNEQKLQTMEAYQKLLSPNANWKLYRAEIQNVSRPAIPYLGLYLSDLTFINDGNPNIVNNGQINFDKWRLTYSILEEIESFQQVGYQIQPVEPLFTFVSEVPRLSDEDLYNLSLKREPRGSDFADLMMKK